MPTLRHAYSTLQILFVTMLLFAVASSIRSARSKQLDKHLCSTRKTTSWNRPVECAVLIEKSKKTKSDQRGTLYTFSTGQGDKTYVFSPLVYSENTPIGKECIPSRSRGCHVYIKVPQKDYWWYGEARYDAHACKNMGRPDCIVYGRTIENKEPPVFAWSSGRIQTASGSTPKPAINPKHPDLGPVIPTTGLNQEMQVVRKNHQVVLSSVKGGRNYFGHGVVRFQIISYEPSGSKSYQFWLSVNCYTKEWKFLENDAVLMGGALEGFGKIQDDQLGRWACGRYGFKY